MKREQLVSFLVLALIVASISSGLVGDYTSGDNAQYLITPAPVMFGIWFPIFAGMLAFGVLQLSAVQRKRYQLDALRWRVLIPFGLAGLWVHLFPVVPPLVQVLIAAATFILAFNAAWHVQPPSGTDERYTWLVSVPLNLFAGWITLASAITINGAYGLPGPSQAIAALTVLIAAAVAAVAVWKLPDPRAYAAAVLWGLCGVLIANQFAVTLTNVLIIGSLLLLAGEFIMVARHRETCS
jgi:hypothetical protein